MHTGLGFRSLHSSRRGFSIIELTIVIGIVGMIIGAIFVANQMLRNKNEYTQATSDLGIIASNVSGYYSGTSMPAPASLAVCPATTALPAPAADLGIFPPQMLKTVAGVKIANNVWNMASNVPTATVSLCGPSPGVPSPIYFVIRFTHLSSQVCINLVSQTSGLPIGSNLDKITISNSTLPNSFSTVPSQSTTSGPVSPAIAAKNCIVKPPATITLDWYFKLRG